MRVFTALSASVYKKSLLLSASGRQEYTSGEVVNLIAVDCSKVQQYKQHLALLFWFKTAWIHPNLTFQCFIKPPDPNNLFRHLDPGGKKKA